MNAWKFHEGQKVEKISSNGTEKKIGVVTNIGTRFVLVQYESQESDTRTAENPKNLRPVE